MSDYPYIENGVFKNKLDITDATALRKMEYESTANKQKEISDKKLFENFKGFSLERQAAIHKHIFEDVYEWAGKTRTIPLSKLSSNGNISVFANAEEIAPKWNALEKKIDTFLAKKETSYNEKITTLADIYIEANHIHPFPEGNGRSLQTFMQQLAKEKGIELDFTKVGAKNWNVASSLSGIHGKLIDHKYLIKEPSNEGLFRQIISEISSSI